MYIICVYVYVYAYVIAYVYACVYILATKHAGVLRAFRQWHSSHLYEVVLGEGLSHLRKQKHFRVR